MAVLTRERRRAFPSVSQPKPVLAMVASAHGITHMYTALLPLVYPFILAQFGISYGELGLIVGVSSALGGVLQLVFGIAGRYVPHKLLIGLGNVFCGVTVALFGAIGGVISFGAVRVLHSVAQAPQHPIGNSMIANRFGERQRGSALSIHVAGGNLGTVLVPLIGTLLIAQLGWRETMVIFSIPGILLGSAIVAAILETKDGQHVVQQEPLSRDVKLLLRDQTVLLIVLSSVVAAGGRGLGVVLTYIPLYLTNGLRLGSTVVGVLFTILLVGSIIGPLLGGRISDSFGRKRTILLTLAGSLVTTLALVLSGATVAAVAASLVFMGLFVYSMGALTQTYLADVVPAASRESIFGAYFAITFLAGAIDAAGIGAIIDHFGFSAAFLTMAASYLAAGLVLLPAREHRLAPIVGAPSS